MPPFKLGNIPFNKGIPHTKEWKEKMSKLNSGRVILESTKEKLRIANLGKRHSKETKQKISESKKGTPAWNKGKATPATVKKKQRDAKLKNPNRYWLGKSRKEEDKYWLGKKRPYDTVLKLTEKKLGGFWYGNVRYPDPNPYCERFTESLRERVRAFFGYKCVECGATNTDWKLDVHHIHYNKKTCCDGSPHDMIPLCHSCHMKSNNNRDYWEKHYTTLLYSLSPTGKCFFTKEEMKYWLESKKINITKSDEKCAGAIS